MNSIYDIANVSRKIFGYGAGVGIPIGNLREKDASIFDGDPNTAPEGKSSGPITFMKLYDAVGETTKSGGRVRRAAIMCTMQCWHPDVMDFISSKQKDGSYANMNISVTFTDKFMEHLDDNTPFPLITPFDGSHIGTIKPKDLWNSLIEMAHKTGDPGVIFIDTINRFNLLKKKILIESTNPCLTGDTLVLTENGLKRIDEITLEDKIFTYNIKDGTIEVDDLSFVGKTRENADIIEIELEDGEVLRLTPDHKVFTDNRGYVKASDLNEDDILLKIE
jgi:ribonucleoside-diphosphate reductase alpha chain